MARQKARTGAKQKPKRADSGARAKAPRLSRATGGTVSDPKAGQPEVIPGELFLAKEDIVALEGRPTIELTVTNMGDRPIQVGSHCHFFEVNRALKFDREKALGFRLQVPAGTAVRFEPGEEKRVTLVAIGGNRVAYGINGLTNGSLDDPQVRERAVVSAREQGFLGKG